ncbi:hypothetical protein MKW98_002980, partial [Papaver atlanticum]
LKSTWNVDSAQRLRRYGEWLWLFLLKKTHEIECYVDECYNVMLYKEQHMPYAGSIEPMTHLNSM